MKETRHSIILTGSRNFNLHMCQMLQKGFQVSIPGPLPAIRVLASHGISEEYLRENVKTVFYNSSPVDDLPSLMVARGGTLALSGAMPGLVGAAFRSGGTLSSFRSTISHSSVGKEMDRAGGYITIKLFNVIMQDTGRLFLSRGVHLGAHELCRYLRENEATLNRFYIEALLDGAPVGTYIKLVRTLESYEKSMMLVIVRSMSP